MIGEFGGIGAFVAGKEWKPLACHTYLHVDTGTDEANKYIEMAHTIASRADHVSASVCGPRRGSNPWTSSKGSTTRLASRPSRSVATHAFGPHDGTDTQTTDVELECDGFLNYDRTSKFSDAETEAVRKANQAIIAAGKGAW